MNKMQWKRQENNKLELFVEEDGIWKLYTQSVNFVSDSTMPGASRGFPTFQNCLKQGYEIIPTINN